MNMPSWEELLLSVSDIIGLSRLQFNSEKNRLSNLTGSDGIYPDLASFLEETLINKIQNGELTRANFSELNDAEWKMMEEGDQFRTLVCHFLNNCKPTTDEKMLAEINALKKLSEKIPAVITTNYDCFLETHIFTKHRALVFPSEYYLSDSEGYGDILKIHGTITNPESIVITKKDYDRLNSCSQLVMARVLSLMCHHPIVFIGYSISDLEIKSMIDNIIQSLGPYDLKRFKGNMIHITADATASKPIWKLKKHTGPNNKTFEITELIVPNLKIVFEYLDKIQPVASPQEILRYKSMISDIVLSSNPSNRHVRIINVNESDKIPTNEWAVIFGSANSIQSMITGVIGYKTTLVIEDVLRNRKGNLHASRTHFTTWISEHNNRRGHVPVFFFLKLFNIDVNDLPPEVQEYIRSTSEKIQSKLHEIAPLCNDITDKSQIETFLNSCNKSFHKYTALAFFMQLKFSDL